MVTLSTFPSGEPRDRGQYDSTSSETAPAAFYISAPTEYEDSPSINRSSMSGELQPPPTPNNGLSAGSEQPSQTSTTNDDNASYQTMMYTIITHLKILCFFFSRYLHLNNLKLMKATTRIVPPVHNMNNSCLKELRPLSLLSHNRSVPLVHVMHSSFLKELILILRPYLHLNIIQLTKAPRTILMLTSVLPAHHIKEHIVLLSLRLHLHLNFLTPVSPFHLINNGFLKKLLLILRSLRHCLLLNNSEPTKAPLTISV